MLAVAVIFSHALTLGAIGSESLIRKTTLGTIAVYGFFGISGFLIAGAGIVMLVARRPLVPG